MERENSKDRPVAVLLLVLDAFGGRGGIAKFNRDLASALARSSPVGRVTVVSCNRPVDAVGDLPPGVVWRCGYGHWLEQLMSSCPYDLVICGHRNLLPLAWGMAWRHGARLALVAHGIDVWDDGGRILCRLVARRVDALVAVSRYTATRMRAWAPIPEDRLHILANCIDTAVFTPGAKSPELLRRYGLEGHPVIMTLGRLVSSERYKGVDEIIALLPALRRQRPGLKYLVVGEGDDLPRLQRDVARQGLADAVVFTGYVPEDRKVEHYRLADTFVLCGTGEGFGIVLLEAMACGIPVVASRVDGSREAVLDGALGELADPGNPDDLASAIFRALDKADRREPPPLQELGLARFQARVDAIVRAVVPAP